MKKSTTGKLGKVIEIDEGRIRDHLGEMVSGPILIIVCPLIS